MEIWKTHNIQDKVYKILKQIPANPEHGSKPFISAYQLAIYFKKDFLDVFKTIDKPIGGEGKGEEGTSLSQYLSSVLASKIKSKEIKDIEIAFFSKVYRKPVVFLDECEDIISTPHSGGFDLSVFRMKP